MQPPRELPHVGAPEQRGGHPLAIGRPGHRVEVANVFERNARGPPSSEIENDRRPIPSRSAARCDEGPVASTFVADGVAQCHLNGGAEQEIRVPGAMTPGGYALRLSDEPSCRLSPTHVSDFHQPG
jgi:hypothetical protein